MLSFTPNNIREAIQQKIDEFGNLDDILVKKSEYLVYDAVFGSKETEESFILLGAIIELHKRAIERLN